MFAHISIACLTCASLMGNGPLGGSLGGSLSGALSGEGRARVQDVASSGELAQLVRELGAPSLDRRTAAEQGIVRALAASAGRGASRAASEKVLSDLRRTLGDESPAGSDGSPLAARRQLSVILGADNLLLGLAIQLASDGRQAVRAVGEEAIFAQLSRWSRSVLAEPATSVYDVPRQRAPLPKPLLERASFRISLDPNGSAPDSAAVSSGASAFDLLDRRGGASLPIVVDPAFVERMARRPAVRLGAARIDGSWSEILEDLCDIHDGAYQLQGYRFPGEVYFSDLPQGPSADDDLPPARAWIHVVQRGTTQLAPEGRDLRKTGAESIVEWCRSAGAEGDLIRQGAAARALAVLGWPAAIHWLERQWAWYGDVTALEGLIAAAARGRVAPSLQDPRCLHSILSLVEGDAEELAQLRAARNQALAPETLRDTGARYAAAASALDGRLQRLALGLRELVPVVVLGERLQSLDKLLFDDFDSASAEGKWLRLAVAEGIGVESAPAAAAARALLKGPFDRGANKLNAALQRPLRRQALRTLGVVQPIAAGRGARDAAIPVAEVSDFFAPLSAVGGREFVGIGLELGRLEPLDVQFRGRSSFDWAAAVRRPAVLRELLVWAALAAEVRGASEAAPDWVLNSVRASLREAASSRTPDPRGQEKCAVRLAARELRVLGGTPLPALLQWVRPKLRDEEFSVLESLMVQAGSFSMGTQPMDPGGAATDLRQRIFEGAVAELQRSGQDASAVERSWLTLGALSTDAQLGAASRRALTDSLAGALADPSGIAATSTTVAYAAESALRALREARLDAEAKNFLSGLRRAAQAADHPLGQLFRRPDWLPAPATSPRDLERVDPVRPPIFRFR